MICPKCGHEFKSLVAVAGGKAGGKARVKKGFASARVLRKALATRKRKARAKRSPNNKIGLVMMSPATVCPEVIDELVVGAPQVPAETKVFDGKQLVPADKPKTTTRLLRVIAGEIRKDWKNMYFGAVPYFQAMAMMDFINQDYGCDSGSSIVAYFLANANTWRGEVARRIKKELNAMLKSAK